MNLAIPRRLRRLFERRGATPFAFCLLLLLNTTGCQREEIQVYTAPKDKQATPSAVAETGVSRPRPPRAQVSWTLPQGWEERRSDRLSVAAFAIKGPDETEAQVTITPLVPLGGGEPEIVNMWREQVGQEPLSREEAAKQLQPVQVGGEPGKLFEIAGRPGEGAALMRIVTAMVHRQDASWFYKLSGDAALVEAQKPIFLEFLKSVRLKDPPPAETARAEGASKPKWTVPSQWRELPPGEMQMAKFAVPARGEARAEVSVSIFPNDTGGTLANVNRWRRQIGLPEVQAADLSSVVSPLDPATPDAILVDMTNNSKRMLGAIVPRGSSYWFYKLQGDTEAVAPEKESFVAFVKSQP